jgi:predicted lipoprotein with Yx(FWY)xxD motif
MALYTFKNDTRVKRRVRRELRDELAALPPGEGRSDGDLKASDFASISREDGQKQTTYQGNGALLLRARRRAGRHEGQRREGDLVARGAVRGTAEQPRRDG